MYGQAIVIASLDPRRVLLLQRGDESELDPGIDIQYTAPPSSAPYCTPYSLTVPYRTVTQHKRNRKDTRLPHEPHVQESIKTGS